MSKFSSKGTGRMKANCYAAGGLVRAPAIDGGKVMQMARRAAPVSDMAVEGKPSKPRGDRVKNVKDGAGGGLGRLEKMRMQGGK